MSNKFDFKTLDTGFAADWPVSVPVPADGGLVETQEFLARFRTLTPAEQEGLPKTEDYLARAKAMIQLGFVDLAKSEGEKLTPEMFEKMWSATNVQVALIGAYRTFQSASPAKN